ncbi:polysaccharide deacetylase family protein [Romboutsia sp. 1001713B170207_170306_H8]|uniref:polysaccharide deacetylase family protein n=1 Tax=Romboutsia sp. 1001713B170207_170306_H8 TaxID=2787112 RepID=UPI001898F9A9|nr:polysaccharide deacetylase family protein [Romboutsia sp. 1001713B170207_170306_H8]
MNNKNIFSQKKKRSIRPNRILTLLVALTIVFGGVKVVSAATKFIQEQQAIKLEEKRKEEEAKALAEKKRKEEEEKKKYIVGCNNDAKKYSYDAKKVEEKLNSYDYSNNGEKVVFLTFDDGTSTTVTPEVLRILKENDVHATFFVTGQNIERGGDKAKELLKEELANGHAIANHSYSHDYKTLYPNKTLDLDAFKADFAKTDELLKDTLGKYFSTRVIRCPGGHMSWRGMDPLDAYLDENNMASIDWNALNKDAEGRRKNADELTQEAIKTSEGKEMVVLLMHDTYGKEETAKALPQIIKYFKDNGYEFKTLV